MRINKPIMIMLVFLCSLNGCSKYDASVSHDSEKINTNQENVTTISKNIAWQNKQVYDFYSGIGDEWSSSIIENEKYIFYTTIEGIVRINKVDCKKTFILRWKKKQQRLAWLYLNKKDLFYTPNGKKVYVMNVDGCEKKKVLSISMIEGELTKTKKEKYLRPFIYGMRIYNNKMYFLTEEGRFYFDVINKKLQYIDIGDARVDCFFDNALIYINSQHSGIYRYDFTAKKREVIREKDAKDIKQYQEVFVYKNVLYYICDDKLYMYSKNRKDVLVSKLSSGQTNMQRVFCKDAIYYSYMEWIDEDKGQYKLHLCEYNNGKVLHDFILPDDCEQLCGVLQKTLFYDVDSSDCSYKVFNIR